MYESVIEMCVCERTKSSHTNVGKFVIYKMIISKLVNYLSVDN